MKNNLYIVFIACFAMLFASCNQDEDWSSQKHYMQLDILGEEYESDKPFPCTVLDFDEWVLVEYTNDGLEEPNTMPFLCVNKVHDLAHLLIGYENGVVLAEYDLLKGTTGDNAIIMNTVDGYDKYSLVKFQYQDGVPTDYQVLSEMSEKAKDDSSNKARRKDYNDDYASSMVQIIEKHLNEFDTKVSMWLDATGDATGVFKGNIKLLGWAITGVVNATRKQLLDVPGLDETTKNNIKSDIGESILLTICKRPWRMMYNAELWALKKTGLGQIFINQFQDWHDQLTAEEPIDEIPVFPRLAVLNQMEIIQAEAGKEPPKYVLSLSLHAVDETSASFGVSYDFANEHQMSFISSSGLECWNKATGKKITTQGSLESEMLLSNLDPLTDYMCCAYLNSFGRKYVSNYVDFTTKGDLTLTPSGAHFSVEGGSQNVQFGIRRNSIAAWDYKAPDWCKIEKYDDWFRIVVGENKGKKAHSGTISINVSLISGKKTSASMLITQDKPEIPTEDQGGSGEGDENYGSGNWNGTTWYFSNGSQYDFNFTVKNLDNQNLTYGGFLDDKNSWAKEGTYVLKTNEGILIHREGPWNNIGIHLVEINIVRTGSRTATAYLTYREIPIFGNENKATVVLEGKRK